VFLFASLIPDLSFEVDLIIAERKVIDLVREENNQMVIMGATALPRKQAP